VPHERRGEAHQALGQAAGGEKLSGEEEEGNGEQQDLAHAGNGVLDDGGLGQEPAERSRRGHGRKEGERQGRAEEKAERCHDPGDQARGVHREAGRPLRQEVEREAERSGGERGGRAAVQGGPRQHDEEGEAAAERERGEAQPLRQPEHRRGAADQADDGRAADRQHERAVHRDGVGDRCRDPPSARRQAAHDRVEAHGQRARRGERRANGDQRHVEPDRELVRPHEPPAEQVAPDHGGHDDEEKGREDRGAQHLQRCDEPPERPLRPVPRRGAGRGRREVEDAGHGLRARLRIPPTSSC
jgi:hypothetical protein